MNDPQIKDNPFKGFAIAMLQGLKPQVVGPFTNAVYAVVEGKNGDDKANDSKAVSDVKQQTGIDELEFKSIGSSKVDGNSAVVPVTFYSKDLKKDVDFNVVMKKLDDGTWQAVKIENLKDFFTEMQPLFEKK